MSKDGIETAFPMTEDCDPNQTGLTKREYFSAKAMQGILSNRESHKYCSFIDIAHMSVKQADELIKELNKTESK